MTGRQPPLLSISVFLASIITTSGPGLQPRPFDLFSALPSAVLGRGVTHSAHLLTAYTAQHDHEEWRNIPHPQFLGNLRKRKAMFWSSCGHHGRTPFPLWPVVLPF